MILATGEMWSCFDSADLFLISTCGSLTSDKKLVMGKGIALEARGKFPGVDKALGAQVRIEGTYMPKARAFRYGLITSPSGKKLGAFQTKYQWSDTSDIDLIVLGVVQLVNWCAYYPEAEVLLNFPGIGNGKLAEADVLPLLQNLSDRVTIWRR